MTAAPMPIKVLVMYRKRAGTHYSLHMLLLMRASDTSLGLERSLWRGRRFACYDLIIVLY